MFAALTPALIVGAVAEHMRFGAFCALTLGWTTLVYDPLTHWAWAPDGWLNRLGALDFAGGTVVHLSSGVSALVAAVGLGAATAGCCFVAVAGKRAWGNDDALDAFGIYGVGGAFGAVATGLLASRAVNAAGADGLVNGQWDLLGKQLVAQLAVASYAATVTWALLWCIRRAMGLRVPAEAEREGLDTAVHGESGYAPGG